MEKLLYEIRQCDAQKITDRILPDIIIHRRRERGRGNNLLVIEPKKNSKEDACDKRKLELLTSPDREYQYFLGLYLNVAGGAFDCTWFQEECNWRSKGDL